MTTRKLNRLTQRVVDRAKPRERVEPLSKHQLWIGPGRDDYALMSSANGRIITRNGEQFVVMPMHSVMRDGGGLLLNLAADGSKSWAFQYAVRGAPPVISRNGRARPAVRTLGLGPAHTITLEQARAVAENYRRMLISGGDPASVHRRKPGSTAPVMTFDQCRDAYVAQLEREGRWRSAKYAREWVSAMDKHISPVLGRMNVADIDGPHVIAALEQIWHRIPIRANRLRVQISQVLDWAEARKYRSGANPARWAHIRSAGFGAPRDIRPVVPMEAVPWREAPAFLAEVMAIDKRAAKALVFLTLTAARTGEILKMCWGDVGDDGVWVKPAETTKAKRPHRVPLCRKARDLLASLPGERRPEDRVFPMGTNAMFDIVRRLRPGKMVHGLRSTFRDWTADNGWDAVAAEQALGHSRGTGTVAAYFRSDLLERRVPMMEAWAAHLLPSEAGENVVPMRSSRG